VGVSYLYSDAIEDKLDYDQWYCGHFHTNRTSDITRLQLEGFKAQMMNCCMEAKEHEE